MTPSGAPALQLGLWGVCAELEYYPLPITGRKEEYARQHRHRTLAQASASLQASIEQWYDALAEHLQLSALVGERPEEDALCTCTREGQQPLRALLG